MSLPLSIPLSPPRSLPADANIKDVKSALQDVLLSVPPESLKEDMPSGSLDELERVLRETNQDDDRAVKRLLAEFADTLSSLPQKIARWWLSARDGAKRVVELALDSRRVPVEKTLGQRIGDFTVMVVKKVKNMAYVGVSMVKEAWHRTEESEGSFIGVVSRLASTGWWAVQQFLDVMLGFFRRVVSTVGARVDKMIDKHPLLMLTLVALASLASFGVGDALLQGAFSTIVSWASGALTSLVQGLPLPLRVVWWSLAKLFAGLSWSVCSLSEGARYAIAGWFAARAIYDESREKVWSLRTSFVTGAALDLILRIAARVGCGQTSANAALAKGVARGATKMFAESQTLRRVAANGWGAVLVDLPAKLYNGSLVMIVAIAMLLVVPRAWRSFKRLVPEVLVVAPL